MKMHAAKAAAVSRGGFEATLFHTYDLIDAVFAVHARCTYCQR